MAFRFCRDLQTTIRDERGEPVVLPGELGAFKTWASADCARCEPGDGRETSTGRGCFRVSLRLPADGGRATEPIATDGMA